MPTTDRKYFTSVTETGGFEPWSGEDNILVEANRATCPFTVQGGSNWLELVGPLAGPDVPVGSTIDNIEIRINCERDGGEMWVTDASILGGTEKDHNFDIGAGIQTEVWSESPGGWGLSEAETQAFLDGDPGAYFRFRALSIVAVPNGFVYWVDCQITYTEPVSLIAPPVMF